MGHSNSRSLFICRLQPLLMHLLLAVPRPWVSLDVVVLALGMASSWQPSQGLWSPEPGLGQRQRLVMKSGELLAEKVLGYPGMCLGERLSSAPSLLSSRSLR